MMQAHLPTEVKRTSEPSTGIGYHPEFETVTLWEILQASMADKVNMHCMRAVSKGDPI